MADAVLDEAQGVLEAIRKAISTGNADEIKALSIEGEKLRKMAGGLPGWSGVLAYYSSAEGVELECFDSKTVEVARRVLEVEDLVCVPDEVKEFEKLIGEVLEQDPSTPGGKAARNQIYYDLELFRMCYSRRPHVSAYSTQVRRLVREKKSTEIIDKKNPGMKETISRLNDIRHRLRIKPPSHTPLEMVYAFCRMVSSFLWVMLSVPLNFAVASLRLTHPLLRRMGVNNGSLPLDMYQMYYARTLLAIMNVKIEYKGIGDDLSSLSKKGTIGMFSHGSNLDPFVIQACPVTFKWVGKKSLFMIPILGWIMTVWGHIPIDRKNLKKAKAALNETIVGKIHKWGRSIAISPEGTRTHSGRLGDFKKGPFHLATTVRLPVTPVSVKGAWACWPPGSPFAHPGNVVVEFLSPIHQNEDESQPDDKEAEIERLITKVRVALLKCETKVVKVSAVRDFRDDLGVRIMFCLPFVFSFFLWMLFRSLLSAR